MPAAIIMAVISAFLGGPPGEIPRTPGGGPVVVNSQKSLVDAVGDGFDEAWEYPFGLVPREFPGLSYVSGPGDQGLGPKGSWRKPIVLKDRASGVEIFVNCYRRHERKRPTGPPLTPAAPDLEPDYRYTPVVFHGLRAAAASEVFVFRDGDLLFKVKAAGGNAEMRRRTISGAAETIWKFRQSLKSSHP